MAISYPIYDTQGNRPGRKQASNEIRNQDGNLKKLIIKATIAGVFTLMIFFATTAFSQDLYDINTINEIDLIFKESNWDALLDQLYAEGNEERLIGTAIINGIEFDSVGVRYKGNSSYSPDRVKNPLNIKLDYIIKGQKYGNYGTIKLANVYKDPSFVRETLSYEIARKYFPASHSNYANVTINDTYLGLYTSNQDVDKFFMRSHFSSDENPRIKGELANSTPPGQMGGVWEYLGTDSSSYYDFYALESDYGWQQLIWFLDTLNNNSAYVDQVLNIDRHLWFLAFQNLLVNLDSPINNPQNFYLYKDDAGRFNPIPWDLNESFGAFTMLQSSGPQNPTQLQQLDPFVNLTNSEYPIISKILSNATYRKMYVAHMKTMIEENFSNNWYQTRAQEIQNIIDSDVQADPNKFYSYTDFKNNLDNSVGGSGPPGPGNQQIIGISELMSARINYLMALSEFQAAAPAISNVSSNPSNPTTNSLVWITATVQDAQTVQLAFRYSQSDAFEKIEMKDDGKSNDGPEGDGIYGVALQTNASGFQYYIYAENDNAASFLPARAANEYYTLAVSGDLVINEFLAKNDTTAADQDGEFDDWIELYNNTDSEISLSGYFLSDDGSDLTKWQFPDTTIAAKGYVIIWADKDDNQKGLHANFKLSASGDAIYLMDGDTAIIDEISFGTQQADLSMGRYPNGTGSFVQMTPTFSAQNLNGITGIGNPGKSNVPEKIILEQNYPNPFNPSTQIVVSIQESGMYSLKVYNVLGQEVAVLLNNRMTPGTYTFTFDASQLTSGIYFYNFIGNNCSQTKKMMLMK